MEKNIIILLHRFLNFYLMFIKSLKITSYLIVFIIFVFFNKGYSQRFIDRNLIINPFLGNESSKEKFYPQLFSFGEFGLYRIKTDSDHSWLQKLGLIIEFFGNKDISFGGTSLIEFIADPHNDIRFNPRAIFWEESFFLARNDSKNIFMIGYHHRCKHDIDNLSSGEERSLIYGSVSIRYLIKNFLPLKIQNDLQLRSEIYTIKQDYRMPNTKIKYNLEDLVFSIGNIFNLKIFTHNNFNFYTNFNFIGSFFSVNKNFFEQFVSIDRASVSYGIYAGIEYGKKEKVSVNLNFEKFNDTGIRIQPIKSHLISMSIIFSPF